MGSWHSQGEKSFGGTNPTEMLCLTYRFRVKIAQQKTSFLLCLHRLRRRATSCGFATVPLDATLLKLDEILEQSQQFVTQFLVLQGEVNVGRQKFGPVTGVKTHARHAHGHHAAILGHGL